MNQMKGTLESSKWRETQDLIASAILVVNELSEHLKEVEDLSRLYKANKALRELREIQ